MTGSVSIRLRVISSSKIHLQKRKRWAKSGSQQKEVVQVRVDLAGHQVGPLEEDETPQNFNIHS